MASCAASAPSDDEPIARHALRKPVRSSMEGGSLGLNSRALLGNMRVSSLRVPEGYYCACVVNECPEDQSPYLA